MHQVVIKKINFSFKYIFSIRFRYGLLKQVAEFLWSEQVEYINSLFVTSKQNGIMQNGIAGLLLNKW